MVATPPSPLEQIVGCLQRVMAMDAEMQAAIAAGVIPCELVDRLERELNTLKKLQAVIDGAIQ